MSKRKLRDRSMLTLRFDNTRAIVVDGSEGVLSLAFLEDGKHLLSGGKDGKIRQWRVEDATEVGEAIKTSSSVRSIALSSDQKWIISGEYGGATVWNRNTRQMALTVNEHTDWVGTVDVSLDSTRFATGGLDRNLFIWDVSTGTRLVGPLKHDNNLTAVKFSPSGDCVATTTWTVQSIRIYNAHTGELVRTILVASTPTESIAWSNDSQRIFAISSNVIRQIVVETGAFEWIVPGELPLSLPRHGRFLACFVGNFITFWDTFSGERFGPVFDQPSGRPRSIALSLDNNYLAVGRNNGIITLRQLSDFIPTSNLGRTAIQQSRPSSGIEGPCGDLRALGLCVDESTPKMAQISSPQAQAVPAHVANGIYRIKSMAADVYLTCPQDAASSTIVVKQSDRYSSDSQRWIISHVANGVFRIACRRGNSEIQLSVRKGNEVVCVSGGFDGWTIDPRGDSYVIGNAVDATAIHLTQHPPRVSAMLRENSPYQHWVLELVLSQNMQETQPEVNIASFALVLLAYLFAPAPMAKRVHAPVVQDAKASSKSLKEVCIAICKPASMNATLIDRVLNEGADRFGVC